MEKVANKTMKLTQGQQILLATAAILLTMILSYVVFPPAGSERRAPAEREPVAEEETKELKRPETLSFRTETIEESKRNEVFYEIDLYYPKITGMEDMATQEALNREIKNFATSKISLFKENISEQQEFGAELSSFFDADYTVNLLEKPFLSVAFFVTEYYAGAAHIGNYITVFNYNITQQEEMALDGLFRPDVAYLELISEKAHKELQERFGTEIGAMPEEWWIEEGTAPKPENYQNFGLSEDSLIIYFKPYQISSYGVSLEAEISYQDIAEFFNPESPIMEFVEARD